MEGWNRLPDSAVGSMNLPDEYAWIPPPYLARQREINVGPSMRRVVLATEMPPPTDLRD